MSIISKTISIQVSLLLISSSALANSITSIDNKKTYNSRNEIPIYDINNPNSNGLSHNKFKDYNVSQKGLILNNSMKDATKTQIGGYIGRNKNLKSNAKVILNEVVNTSITNINGPTEIAGQKADLIIANPNGININGGSFINTNNLTITTGKANIINNEVSSFDVKGGNITIEGKGLNSTEQNSTNIYSKTLKVNAKINANKLNIVLGENNISNDGKEITKNTLQSNTDENLLLDSSSLGGMYANRISIVGTKEGLGVKLPPEVLSSLDDFEITNDGFIEINSISSEKNIKLTSTKDDITIKKDLISNENITIHSNKDIIVEKGTINAKSSNINAKSSLKLNNSTLKTKESTNIKSKKLTNNGNILVGFNENNSPNEKGNLNLEIEDNIENKGTILSGKNLNINTKDLVNEKDILSKAEMSLNLDYNLENKGLIQSDKNLDILFSTDTPSEGIINRDFNNNGKIYSKNNLFIKTDNINNTAQILSDGNISINLASSLENTGEILGKEILSISSNSLDNTNSLSAKNIEINTTSINNTGKITIEEALNLSTSNLINTDEISANNISINASDFLNQGLLEVKDELIIETTLLTNENIIQGENEVRITSKDSIFNKGDISSDKEIDLKTNSLQNEKNASIHSNENLIITAIDETKYLSNIINNGIVSSTKDLKISANNFLNSGEISSSTISLNSKTLDNKLGNIESKQNLNINSESINNSGKINTLGNLAITSKDIDNKNAIQAKTATFNIENQVINNNTISVTEKLEIFANSIFNYAKIISNKFLNFDVTDTIESKDLQAGEDLNIKATKLTNTDKLSSSKNLTIDVTTLENNEKSIEAKENLTIKVQNFNHENTTLNSEGNIFLTLKGTTEFDHRESTNINANGDIYIKAYSIFNHKRLATNGSIYLTAQDQFNNSSIVNAGENLAITLPNILENDKNAETYSFVYNDVDSMLIAGNNLNTQSRKLSNLGTIFSSNNINFKVENKLFNKSNIYALNNLNITNKSVFDLCNENFLACKDEDLNGPDVENVSAKLSTYNGDINIIANNFINKRNLDYINLFSEENIFKSYYGNDFLLRHKEEVKVNDEYKNDDDEELIDFSVDLKDKYKIKLDVTRAYKLGILFPKEGIKINGNIIKRENIGKEGEESLLSSGQNLFIKTKNNLTNEVSKILSSKDMTIKADIIENKAITTSGKIKATGKMSGSGTTTLYYWDENNKKQTINLRRNNNHEIVYDKKFLGENLPSTIAAGGSSNIESNNVVIISTNNESKEKSSTPDNNITEDTTTTKLTEVLPSDFSIKTINLNLKGSLPKNRTIEDITSDIEIPSHNFGLFVLNKDPNATYLIETNPEFTLKENFFGSDYFTDQLEYDEELTTKKIGDAFYENKLVLDSIRKQTGKENLFKNLSKEQQFKKLMDNALAVKNDLELIPGLSLTKKQINNLKESIVWLEEKIVNNQRVLVPTVYIANLDDIKVTGATISANENLLIKAQNITNKLGNISANGNVVLSAQNDINNLGGNITSKDANVALFTKDGDINIKTIDENGKKTQSNISANKSVILNSGKDINTEAANINAKENIYLKAKNNITDQAIIEKSSKFYQNKNTTTKTTTQTVTSSKFNGNNVVLDAGNQMLLEATQIEADNAISLKAKDILVLGKESTNTKANTTTRKSEQSESIFNKETQTKTTT